MKGNTNMEKLYRLKSNPKTIVRRYGSIHKVVWSSSMEHGFDSSWMMSKWNPSNVTELSVTQTKHVLDKISHFNAP